MNYEESGVSIKKATALGSLLNKEIKNPNIGMFAGLYEHPVLPEHYLVACTDGIGTKIIPLINHNLIETAATDLIAMNLNDLACLGASPLFFLDYFATNSLNVEIASRFIIQLNKELINYNCTLLGGETSELNDLIAKNNFDVAGFAVGLVKKENLLKKENIKSEDVIIGLKSSGPHSNGYTLIRKLHEKELLSDQDLLESLNPTHIYINEITELCKNNAIKACANITGGGIASNLERIIPEDLCAKISTNNIPPAPIFDKLESIIGKKEAYNTFNMGVGMCIVTSKANIEKVMQTCKQFNPFVLGIIINNTEKNKVQIDLLEEN